MLNVTEGNAVAALLRFATGTMPRNHDEIDALIRVGSYLAGRVRSSLGAGPAPDDVERDLRYHLGELLLEHGDDFSEDARDALVGRPVGGPP
jgi:hypothetical protein